LCNVRVYRRAEMIFRQLTNMENWKNDFQYQAAFVSKLFAFGFVNRFVTLNPKP
jgi:hypothetical protein